jgi:hypothetical protein
VEGGRLPAALAPALAPQPPPAAGGAPSDAGGLSPAASESSVARAAAAAQAALKSIPILPLISRPGTGGHEGGGAGGGAAAGAAQGDASEYELTPQEERLVQACQNSLNSAGASAGARGWPHPGLLRAFVNEGRARASLQSSAP